MLFRKNSEAGDGAGSSTKQASPRHTSPHLKAIRGGAARQTPMRTRSVVATTNDDSVGLVLDAIGGLISALARHPLDLADRSAEDCAEELTAWQRHATLGFPIADGGSLAAVGINERDWDGLVRAVTGIRREEHRHVSGTINDLREALWACVETVHRSVQVDVHTDKTAEAQMSKARSALQRMQTGSIKSEIMGAVSAIEGALQSRKDQQQERYVTLATKLDRLGRQLEEARRESTTDALTGLGNRKLFDAMVPRAIQMFSMARQPVVLLMADVDKLKLINDMYGHQAGDAVITGLATALSKVFLRQSDIVCRIGGDEFAAILSNTDWRTAETLARRLQEHMAELPAPHPSMEFQVGASVGVAQLELHEELDEWVARADRALYRAKQNGRDRVCVAEGLVGQFEA